MALRATSLPFAEQNQFFRRKLNLPTNAWTDIYTREHDYAFVVAGANRDDLVQDFRQAVEKAIADGTTLEEFRRDFDRIVAKYGWSYRGGRNWRSRVIYETNMRSSYMAGRLEQLMAVREERPYWQYLHSDAVEHPRPKHESWNGLVLRWDDPWWQYHFPINAWDASAACARSARMTYAVWARMARTRHHRLCGRPGPSARTAQTGREWSKYQKALIPASSTCRAKPDWTLRCLSLAMAGLRLRPVYQALRLLTRYLRLVLFRPTSCWTRTCSMPTRSNASCGRSARPWISRPSSRM
ncbi:phage minor head protein [Pseudomonas aeruginosa]|uniref:phage head morphogenesis protein n=1 Tax=Pseudomonas aeruginosa TaxID=287 RepID=UPI001F21C590|nr:phage minor head protein [Pseudomonas aeruginosa]